jgi:type I restriction enzyme S subunit
MNNSWPTKKLYEIAHVRISNVDKKTNGNEKPVKLCNYMDVYSNEYITDILNFMEATASTTEIERFGLNDGDVVITKDSETPDDIGIPAVVTEKIEGLVCGYHLALIRPDADWARFNILSKAIIHPSDCAILRSACQRLNTLWTIYRCY